MPIKIILNMQYFFSFLLHATDNNYTKLLVDYKVTTDIKDMVEENSLL